MAAHRLTAVVGSALLLAATISLATEPRIERADRIDRTPDEYPDALAEYYGVNADDPMQAELEAAIRDYYFLYDDRRDGLIDRFRDLAEGGCAHAMYYYALFTPEGADSDAHTRKWMRKGVKHGSTRALYLLGGSYQHGAYGMGPRGQYEEAEKWLRKAAEQGSPEAMGALASMHTRNKVDVERDALRIYGYKWYTLAIHRLPPSTTHPAYGMGSDHDTRARLQRIRDNRLAPRMSDDAIAQAERLVEEWEEAHDHVRRMPEEAEDIDAPLPVWLRAIEGPCDR